LFCFVSATILVNKDEHNVHMSDFFSKLLLETVQ